MGCDSNATPATKPAVTGRPSDVAGAGPLEKSATANQVYLQFEVDTPVTVKLHQPSPKYPEKLRGLGMEGSVTARFIVDTVGHVDTSTFRVVSESDPRFTRSVKEALPQIRFDPAIKDNRPVSQLVEQSFEFNLDH